jgi:fumarate hydratase subunit beta
MKIKTPISNETITSLKAGDMVYITGIMYTARDSAHQKMVDLLKNKKPLPFDPNGQIVYYTGPTPAKENKPIGSCGPTSSYRMDPFAKDLMQAGLKIMIGKGDRSQTFIDDMIHMKGIYLQAVGGIGAFLARTVKKSTVIAFPELGAEAIHELEVQDFPAIVTYDIYGGNLIKDEVKKYQQIDLEGMQDD